MSNQKNLKWSRLDNAAKIFPSTSEGADTRVFRFACELKETVDGALLQRAVLAASESFPHYLAVMRRGVFWYYLEQTDLKPVVEEENLLPCAPLYQRDKHTLLFRVSFYRRRINLEIYHALSDGTGAMEFLKAIIAQYLFMAHPDALRGSEPVFEASAISDKESDSFQKYYQKVKQQERDPTYHAYRLRGERREDNDLQVIEGVASVKAILEAAHQSGTTLTVFLTAILIEAIHQEMYLRDEKKPVVIRVPVNLRSYFPSASAKNFFGIIEVVYSFAQRSGEFSDIVAVVDEAFKRELQKERLAMRMNKLAQLEHNLAAQLVPLPLKNVVLRRARHISDRGETAVISNIGKITLAQPLRPYVDSFHIFASTLKTQLCLCSFGDKLQMGFASAFEGAGLQRNFFRLLTERGIAIEVSANESQERDEEPAPLLASRRPRKLKADKKQ